MRNQYITMLIIALLATGLLLNLVANSRADKNKEQPVICTPKE